jgi:Spy/CpxP family protein refolding chaperone
MKLSKISLIAALVLGGLVAGSTMVRAADATDGTSKKGKGGGKRGGMSVEQTMEKLTTELTLTDEQKPKVKTVIEESTKKMTEMYGDTSIAATDRRSKRQEIMDDREKELKKILTPDQLEKYKKYVETSNAARKKKKTE